MTTARSLLVLKSTVRMVPTTLTASLGALPMVRFPLASVFSTVATIRRARTRAICLPEREPTTTATGIRRGGKSRHAAMNIGRANIRSAALAASAMVDTLIRNELHVVNEMAGRNSRSKIFTISVGAMRQAMLPKPPWHVSMVSANRRFAASFAGNRGNMLSNFLKIRSP